MNPFFFEIHKNMPRQGPGGDIYTCKALRKIHRLLPEKPQVLDVGCGPGRQTVALAYFLPNASIHAIDIHQPFLDALKPILIQNEIANRVFLSADSMDALPFSKESFDVIWSEGALYIMGMQKASRYLRNFLKPGGFLVFSYLTWIKENPPKELVAYWRNVQKVQIGERAGNVASLDANGYDVMETFALPPCGWRNEYYTPLQTRLEMLRLKYPDDQEKIAVIEEDEQELEIYNTYNEFFSYVYYVCKKIG